MPVAGSFFGQMKIQYRSNNSGGHWWLKDRDWAALEAAGWSVEWCANDPDKSFLDSDGKRWLGTLAKEATKEFETPGDAMREFEKITGQEVSDEGCNCCGPPHSFYWGRAVDDTLPKSAEYGSASGGNCLEYMFPEGGPKTLREAWERK